MKNTLLTFFALISLALPGWAQITTSSASFPVAGDTLYMARDTTPFIFVLEGNSPAPLNWDFTALEPQALKVNRIAAASEGASFSRFPDADIILPFYSGNGYAKTVGTDSIEIIGYEGSPYARVSSFYTVTDINPSYTSYLSGLTYGSTFTDYIYFKSEEDGSNIDSDETFGIQPDSVRFTYKAIRQDTVDAWGTMTTPTGTYDVVRVKQVLYSDVKVEAKQSFFGWVNLADFGIEGTGPDTVTTYVWWSNADKEPIARVEKRPNDSNLYCDYKIDRETAFIVNNEDILPTVQGIRVYPNPAVNVVNFELSGLPNDRYTINLYNIIGRKVASKELQIQGFTNSHLNLSDHGRGVYLYSLANSQGKIIKTAQLVINRP